MGLVPEVRWIGIRNASSCDSWRRSESDEGSAKIHDEICCGNNGSTQFLYDVPGDVSIESTGAILMRIITSVNDVSFLSCSSTGWDTSRYTIRIWNVSTADSRPVFDVQNDISKPGAQQRAKIDLCQCENI